MSTDRAAEAFYEALRDDDAQVLYDRAPCGYLSATPRGVITKVNQTLLSLTGFGRDDLLGSRFADLLTVGGRIYHDTHYAPMLLMHGSAREIAVEIVCQDGSRLPVLITSVLERDETGTPRVIRTAVFDATERRRYEQELLHERRRAEASEARARELALALQRGFIPPVPPEIPGLQIATAYHPAGSAEMLGGDFYDVFPVGPDEWAVALGDVAGKGVDAAIMTALVRHTLRAVTIQQPEPAGALMALNEMLLHHQVRRFCTLVLLRLRRSEDAWTATVGLGGHPQPLLLRPGPVPVGVPGSLVGLLPQAKFHDSVVWLAPGETLLLFTDGVTEARHGEHFYGETRLAHFLSTEREDPDLAQAILADVLAFQSGSERDDIAVLSLTVPLP